LSPDSPSGGPGRKIDDPSQAPDGGANESVALGYIASRTVESILILVGVLSLMAVVSLRQDLAATGGTDGARVDVLGYLMWRSRLLPRPMVTFGLIGGCPLALVAGVGVLLGAWDTPRGSPWHSPPRGPPGALAQCLAARPGFPAVTDPHRPPGVYASSERVAQQASRSSPDRLRAQSRSLSPATQAMIPATSSTFTSEADSAPVTMA
jgi:hypothetical protein